MGAMAKSSASRGQPCRQRRQRELHPFIVIDSEDMQVFGIKLRYWMGGMQDHFNN